MRPTRTMLSHLSQSLSVSLSVCLSLSLCHTPTHTLSVSSLRQSCYRRYRRIITVRHTRTMLSASYLISLSLCLSHSLSLSLCHTPTHTLSVSSLRHLLQEKQEDNYREAHAYNAISSLCLCLSHSLSVCLFLSVTHPHTLCLSLPSRNRRIITERPTRTMLSRLSVSVCLTLCLSVSFSLSHTHTHSVCLFPPPVLLQEI